MDRGYSTHGRHIMGDPLERQDQPVLTQIKKAYWKTKHQLMKKIGKNKDEYIAASDAELDAKLDSFKQIQISCLELLKVIYVYQKRLLLLAREENSMGRFLKTHGDEDSTQAGKMMIAVGKSQTFSAQQRIHLRTPLYRLYQEVQTFYQQAVADTQITVSKMEEARTAYRSALLWMKDASEALDPEAYNRLEKFREVQSQVRKAKEVFDKYKLDVMQKIDLLAASRSNMFSHALAVYQNSLLQFWAKTSKTMNAVSETFKGFQYYEFNVLKSDLDDAARGLAKETASEKANELLESLLKDTGHNPQSEEDKLIYDIIMSLKDKKQEEAKITESVTQEKPSQPERQDSADSTTGLLDLMEDVFNNDHLDNQFGEFQAAMDKETKEFSLIGEHDKYSALRQDEDTFLDDIFATEKTSLLPADFVSNTTDDSTNISGGFLPADLLESDLAGLQLHGAYIMPSTADESTHQLPSVPPPPYEQSTTKLPTKSKASQQPMASWYNLFADLDPLQDPDAVGKKNPDKDGCA